MPKTLLLKNIPTDVYSEILQVQSDERKKTAKVYSLESAVYKIIKGTIKEKK